MADKKGDSRIIAEIDREAIEKFNKTLQHSLEREAKLQRHFDWRGSKLPPFSIEHLPLERQRLSQPMTAEDRKLRKQWLMDQELSPKEPRYIPELFPKNPIKRLLAAPWNFVFSVIKPIAGDKVAMTGRFFVPKLTIFAMTVYATYYHLKYNPNQWTDKHGWNIHSTKPTLVPDGVEMHQKEESDFYDRGFKHRTVLLK